GITKIRNILTKLEFIPKSKGKGYLEVIVPSQRQDIKLEIDLIEEIARIYGYENVPITLPKINPDPTSLKRNLVLKIKNTLISLGLNEVITYSLISRDLLGDRTNTLAIEILNPLSKEQELLRPTLIPSLARVVAYNLNQRESYVNIFEIAKVFYKDSGQIKERWNLGIALCGRSTFYLSGEGGIREEFTPLYLKGILETLFRQLGIKDISFSFLDTGEIMISVRDKIIGLMKGLEKSFLERFAIKNKAVYVAEVALEKILPFVDLKKTFTPLPKYPGISRDISLILKEEIKVADLLPVIEEKGKPLLEEVKVVDFYQGKQIPPGFKGLTISCFYRLQERTLTEDEIKPRHAEILEVLKEKFSAQIR
ncbi:MAG: hypothetical protein NC928_03895, partial [Candidatus Omnitrophica bacterium]|nr:hypothetical protein [Candidatus Omnitrophota bacterium]